ncbi:hypothetical protein ABK040_003670 [Willaertia magna]
MNETSPQKELFIINADKYISEEEEGNEIDDEAHEIQYFVGSKKLTDNNIQPLSHSLSKKVLYNLPESSIYEFIPSRKKRENMLRRSKSYGRMSPSSSERRNSLIDEDLDNSNSLLSNLKSNEFDEISFPTNFLSSMSSRRLRTTTLTNQQHYNSPARLNNTAEEEESPTNVPKKNGNLPNVLRVNIVYPEESNEQQTNTFSNTSTPTLLEPTNINSRRRQQALLPRRKSSTDLPKVIQISTK